MVAVATPRPAPAPADEAPPRGCAWYDSSYELQRGLRVSECAEPAALAALPLSWWLAWELDAARPSIR